MGRSAWGHGGVWVVTLWAPCAWKIRDSDILRAFYGHSGALLWGTQHGGIGALGPSHFWPPTPGELWARAFFGHSGTQASKESVIGTLMQNVSGAVRVLVVFESRRVGVEEAMTAATLLDVCHRLGVTGFGSRVREQEFGVIVGHLKMAARGTGHRVP